VTNMLTSEDEEIIEKWFLLRNISPTTQKQYLRSVNLYVNLLGKNLSELLKEAKEENLSKIELIDRKVTFNLLKYKKYLLESGRAPGTINLLFFSIVSFYKAYNIFLPDIKLEKGDIGLEKNIGKRLEKTDIQKLVGVASPRERALIYLMALSGMGQQEARDLKIKTLIDAASEATRIDLKDVYDLFSHEEQVLNEVLALTITRKRLNTGTRHFYHQKQPENYYLSNDTS